ncbi:MAG: energy transducer TonB [Verrucomicrobia bacterium]|nr:energy transducer TonB [Verrucomicrobiota bacterium]
MILPLLSQTAHVLRGGSVILPGRPYPSSSLHFPKASAKYDTPPKLISGNAPLYPISQSRSGNSGFAIVAFTVGLDGKTHDIRVVRASYPYFGSHTVLAVRDWRFEPGRKNGKPVPVKINLVMPFKS